MAGPALLAEAKAHYDGCNASVPIPAEPNRLLIGSHTWALKTVLFNYLLSYFNNPCLSALLFPPVLYNGTPVRIRADGKDEILQSPMLHWVVLCRFADPEQAAADCSPVQYLARSCVAVSPEKKLFWSPQTGETDGHPRPPDSLEWLNAHGAQVLQGL